MARTVADRFTSHFDSFRERGLGSAEPKQARFYQDGDGRWYHRVVVNIGDNVVELTWWNVLQHELVQRADFALGPSRWDFDGNPTTVDDSLTLTACHPKFSASQRIVVAAELVSTPAPTTTGTAEDEPTATADVDAGLSGERTGAWPAAGWAAVSGTIGGLAWIVARRHPAARWQAYGVVVAPFLVALFYFFENFSALLPANF